MSENAWGLLIRPLLADIAMGYLALMASLFLAKAVWQAVRAVFTTGRNPARTVHDASFQVKPVAPAKLSRSPKRRPSAVLIRRPKLARAALVSRSSRNVGLVP